MAEHKFRIVGRRNTYSRQPEHIVWKFEDHEEDSFYRVWEDMEDAGFDVWVYMRGDKGTWEVLL